MSIVVYTKPSCVPCKATKRMLEKHGVDYTSVDVTKDSDAFDHVMSLGYAQVPVVEYGRESWYGFRPDRIQSLIDRVSTASVSD